MTKGNVSAERGNLSLEKGNVTEKVYMVLNYMMA